MSSGRSCSHCSSVKARTGKPAHEHRRIVNGILWLHRTGSPWRDIPERYGNHRTLLQSLLPLATSRYQAECLAKPDAVLRLIKDKLIGKCILLTVAAVVRAHQHAAGALVGDPEAHTELRSNVECNFLGTYAKFLR